MSAQYHLKTDPHTLLVQAREMCAGIASLASEAEGQFEQLTGDQLYFLLSSLNDKLGDVLEEMEREI